MEHLLVLLQGTKALAAGDLSTRIPLPAKGDEFEEVALSFNQMAHHFETMIHRLQHGSQILNDSADQIAASAAAHEQHVIEQERATREIEGSAERIAHNAHSFAHTLDEVGRSAAHASSIAHDGRGSLEMISHLMERLVENAGGLGQKLAVLEQRGEEVQTIVTMMGKFADQTNLLSLNAAIEAESAGEYGRGFGVIAREVRRLADQTASAALDIEKNIGEMRKSVRDSVNAMTAFATEIQHSGSQVRNLGQELGGIIAEVERLTEHFIVVNQGMQEQLKGAEGIRTSLAQLSEIAGRTAQAIRVLQETIQELHASAKDLRGLAIPG
jgi:methyl-accepting chemotaxis protein WspA